MVSDSNSLAKEEINTLNKKIEKLNRELNDEKNNSVQLKKQLESMQAQEIENNKILKEVSRYFTS